MFERICIILLANIVFFAKTICYKYTSDDIPVLQESKKLTLNIWQRIFRQIEGGIRTEPQQDHFLTTIIHALVCVFIYIAFGSNDISFWAAILFAFNPINNQGSVWISGRSYPLSALLVLMAMTFLWISPLCILAVMYFPAGFILSFVLPFWNPIMIIFIILSGLLHFKRIKGLIGNKTKKEMFDEDKKIQFSKIILVIKTFGFYTLHALIPIKTTFYHSFMQSMAGAGKEKAYKIDRFFFMGNAFFLAFAYKVFFTPWDIMSFGIVWWVIGIAPFLNLFRISQEIAERYAYAPNVGLMIALAHICIGSPVAIGVVISMYATKLWFYMDCYQDDYYLSEQACLNSPDSWFAWHVRALKRWDVQSYKEAIIYWTMAKNISPNEFKVLFNISSMLIIVGHKKEAEAYLAEAEKNIPKGQEETVKEVIENWRKGKVGVLV